MKNYMVIIIVSFTATSAMAERFPKLDEALPSMIDIRDQIPVIDWDTDGCYPAAGISRDGIQNPGLKTTGSITGDCRHEEFLDTSNTLHRYACIDAGGDQYCAHLYDSYYEKDQVVNGSGAFGGHRHDWESIAIWTLNGDITHGAVSAHGDMDTDPKSELPMEDDHMKAVYHKDGGGTHAFRFAKLPEEEAENSYGTFVTPTVASWYELTGDGISNREMRDKLNSFDYDNASIKVKDSRFLNYINEWRPSSYPEFTQQSVEDSNPNKSLNK